MLQYVPQFREKTFVVAVDGAAVADENFVNILMDVAVLWSLSIRTVLVHGASVQVRALAEQRGVEPSDLEGSGVTDAATLKLALNAANRLTHEILEGLSAADLRAASTNAVIAHPLGILRGSITSTPARSSGSTWASCRRSWPTGSSRWYRRSASTARGTPTA